MISCYLPNLTSSYDSFSRHSSLEIGYSMWQYALYALVSQIEMTPNMARFHHTLVPIKCAIEFTP